MLEASRYNGFTPPIWCLLTLSLHPHGSTASKRTPSTMAKVRRRPTAPGVHPRAGARQAGLDTGACCRPRLPVVLLRKTPLRAPPGPCRRCRSPSSGWPFWPWPHSRAPPLAPAPSWSHLLLLRRVRRPAASPSGLPPSSQVASAGYSCPLQPTLLLSPRLQRLPRLCSVTTSLTRRRMSAKPRAKVRVPSQGRCSHGDPRSTPLGGRRRQGGPLDQGASITICGEAGSSSWS